MKLVGVIDGEPFDPQLWSGSSRYLFEALQRRGVLHDAVQAIPGPMESALYQLLSFQPDIDRWKAKYHVHLGYYRAFTRQARRALKQIPDSAYDLILQIGVWYDLTRHGRKPVSALFEALLGISRRRWSRPLWSR